MAQLKEARLAGHDPAQVAAQLTNQAMLRNLTIAHRLGCLGPEGLHDMRRGQSPITLGPYAGDQLSGDHIIPFSVAQQLDSRAAVEAARQIMIAWPAGRHEREVRGSQRHRQSGTHAAQAEHRLMPLRLNIGKRDKMGERQHDLLRRLRAAGWRL